ncbi:MAG: OsmC family protein [Pseudomonadota bacterium]
MTDELASRVAATHQEFKSNPSSAQAVFKSESNVTKGFRSDISIRQHQLVVDEPPSIGGDDAGPNPIELVLAALGSCQEITYKAFGAALGIDVQSVSVQLDGEINLRGFFGIDEDVRAGFQNIRGTVTITSSASDEELAKLRDVVNSHCPVLDMLSTPVPTELSMRRA